MRMNLSIVSDLHLEFADFSPAAVQADVFILAGDIGLRSNGIDWAAHHFPNRHVIYVAGNHEFYGSDRCALTRDLKSKCEQFGIHFLDNSQCILLDPATQVPVRFLGVTLWTDFMLFGSELRQQCIDMGNRYLNDFRLIREGSDAFTVERSIQLHQQSLAWLTDELQKPFDGKTVVISHHLPSKESVAVRYKDDLLSACFASELSHLFGSMALWVHGHTHDSFDYQVNGTRVVCNPRGYVRSGRAENPEFNPSLLVTIE